MATVLTSHDYELLTPEQKIDVLFSIKRRQYETDDGCLEITGWNADGYPKVQIANQVWRVNRLIMAMNGVEVQARDNICHTCNNARCIRFKHLYVGDQITNMQDSIRTGTYNNQPILSFQEVREIREIRLWTKTPINQIAEIYRVPRTLVRGVIHRRTYRNVKPMDPADGLDFVKRMIDDGIITW